MINFNRRTKVFACIDPVSMSFSFDGLFSLVKYHMNLDPMSGHIFIFVNKAGNMCKALYWDGTGLVILGKRLEQGRFTKFNPLKKIIEMTPAEFSLFFEGADLQKRFIESPKEFKMKQRSNIDIISEDMSLSPHVANGNSSTDETRISLSRGSSSVCKGDGSITKSSGC